jgi:hypothetical protein
MKRRDWTTILLYLPCELPPKSSSLVSLFSLYLGSLTTSSMLLLGWRAFQGTPLLPSSPGTKTPWPPASGVSSARACRPLSRNSITFCGWSLAGSSSKQSILREWRTEVRRRSRSRQSKLETGLSGQEIEGCVDDVGISLATASL